MIASFNKISFCVELGTEEFIACDFIVGGETEQFIGDFVMTK